MTDIDRLCAQLSFTHQRAAALLDAVIAAGAEAGMRPHEALGRWSAHGKGAHPSMAATRTTMAMLLTLRRRRGKLSA